MTPTNATPEPDLRVRTYTCTTRIGFEDDGVMPIYCGIGNAAPLAGNSCGHALCAGHVRTASRRTVKGSTTFYGPPIGKGV